MLDLLIDKLFIAEKIGSYFVLIIQILMIIVWVFLTRKSNKKHKMSFVISLSLLLISILLFILTFKPVAYTISEYAFLFLGIGIIQSIFSE